MAAIKQTDFDGQTDYSKTVMVKYDLPKTLVLYPNPTESGNINIRGNVVSTFAKANIQIIDPYGKVHYESQVDPDALEDGVKLKPNGIMKTGIYIIVINDGSKISKKKLIIK